jgi:putative component of membrane protein insertase Oxa1/YidC/SpoIIIJ protein YidD
MMMIRYRWVLLISLWCIATAAPASAQTRMRGPDDRSVAVTGITKDSDISTAGLIGRLAIQAYARLISPVDGPRSPSYPTSTAYGRQAIRQHGFVLGVVLIADRLLHEADAYSGPRVILYGRSRYYDPIENNTYWWNPPLASVPTEPR